MILQMAIKKENAYHRHHNTYRYDIEHLYVHELRTVSFYAEDNFQGNEPSTPLLDDMAQIHFKKRNQ